MLRLLLIPVALVILAFVWVARVVDGLTGEWGWLTLLAGCYAAMAVPVLFWPGFAGAGAVVMVKGFWKGA